MHGMNTVIPTMPWLAAAAALALLLLSGAAIHTDISYRRIPNSLCGAIALLSPAYAFGEGGWPGIADFAAHLVIIVLIALPLVLLFVVRALGGGDVKLLLALLLWVPAIEMPLMLAVTMAAGMAIAIGLKLLNKVFCFIRADTVPYGLAIVAGALVVLLPRFDGLPTATCALVI